MEQTIYNSRVSTTTRGRPPEFDRDRAILEAARAFWRHGYSGTSTRELTAAIGISTSSLYSAFGNKAGLFKEAVTTYANRYSEIYQQAVAAASIRGVVDEIFRHSITEFTQSRSDHPGCLVTSAVMIDSPETIDTRRFIADMQSDNTELLRARMVRAIDEGEIIGGSDPALLSDYVQTIWHGLSDQSNRGVSRGDLLRIADFSQRALWSTYSR